VDFGFDFGDGEVLGIELRNQVGESTLGSTFPDEIKDWTLGSTLVMERGADRVPPHFWREWASSTAVQGE
jgi:hypothetical protein